MKSIPRIGLALLSSLLLATLVQAQADEATPERPATEIAGNWSFVANTGPDCTFSGNALLIATEDPNRYGCELTALQVCSIETWQVRQSCTASRQGEQLVITSKIEEFVQGTPNQGYRADNFKLTIKSASLMTGVLVSWGFHLAEFRRSEGSIS